MNAKLKVRGKRILSTTYSFLDLKCRRHCFPKNAGSSIMQKHSQVMFLWGRERELLGSQGLLGYLDTPRILGTRTRQMLTQRERPDGSQVRLGMGLAEHCA